MRPVRTALLLVLTLAPGLAACAADEPYHEPRPISATSPFRYPIAEWDAGREGQTMLMVHVTDMGEVDSVYVAVSSGSAGLDSAAARGAYELRFAPARRGERRVDAWARLPVRFRRSGEDAPAGPG